MLTITAPIKTVLDQDLCKSNESFAQRIIANYDQMGEFIDREDLFHVVTQPPEVFLMGGGESSFLSETEVYNTQHKKVEIINNLMNRILVSADGNLTYQDEVYITNVLHRLGITDERTFMKKAYALFEETKQNNELIETYWENRQELSQMIAFYRMQHREGDTVETGDTTQEILHLHEDVFKRWMTAAVYRMQNNFRTTADSRTMITADSYRMTEEQRLSQQILLQRLRESVRGESVPLIYHHENYYESPGEDEAASRDEAIATQIASAVLLSIADNLYENITVNSGSVEDRYYRTENAYYGAADHVFERMEGNTSYIISQYRQGDVTAETTENIKNEISAISQIVDRYYSSGDEITNRFFESDIIEAAEMVYPEAPESAEETGETPIHVDVRNSIEQQLFETNILNEQRQRVYMENQKNLSEQTDRIRGGAKGDDEIRRAQQMAFEHPEEFIQRTMEEREAEAEGQRELTQQFLESLPPATSEVYRAIAEYMESPESFTGLRYIQRDAEYLLERERIEAERDEVIRESSERITKEITKEAETIRARNDVVNRSNRTGRTTVNTETVDMVHRINDVTVDEETIESLRREINQVKNDTERVETRIDNRENVETQQINNINSRIIRDENIDDITRMIQDNLNKQIGNITSKVYDRLERQLMSERRRRGM